MDSREIERELLSGKTLKAIADEQGRSYFYLRKLSSQYGWDSARKIRRKVVVRFKGATAEDIALFLKLYHDQDVSPNTIKGLMRRIQPFGELQNLKAA